MRKVKLVWQAGEPKGLYYEWLKTKVKNILKVVSQFLPNLISAFWKWV